jgi:glutamate-1-semialdehyde 2,1-aminomutase
VFGPVVRAEYDMAGTFNGNPLTMAASRAALTEVLTPDAYGHFDQIHGVMAEGCGAAIQRHGLPAYVTGLGAKGSVIYSRTPVKEYRDTLGIDERVTYLAWLFQQNRGVFKSPWTKQETWTTSVFHTTDDAARYVENFDAFAEAISA